MIVSILLFIPVSFLVFYIAFCIGLKIYVKFFHFWCSSPVYLDKKVALITGGCVGIGYEISIALASRGCKVIVADKAISEEKRQAMIKATHNSNIVFEYVDLASFKSVREFAARLNKNEEKLDILINNAGMAASDWVTTDDGLHLVLQVNFYSHFLLTHLCIDLLTKSGSGRVIFTSSLLSFFHFMAEGELESLRPGAYISIYGKSKYLQIVTSDVLAEKLERFNITCNCWHPLVVNTNIFMANKGLNGILAKAAIFPLMLLAFIAKTPSEGAQTGIYLACADEVKNTTGEFFSEGNTTWKPSYTSEFQKLAWKHSEEAVKLRPEEKL